MCRSQTWHRRSPARSLRCEPTTTSMFTRQMYSTSSKSLILRWRWINAKATILNLEADLEVKKAQNARRAVFTTLSTSIEEKQVFDGNAKMAEAALASAKAALSQAEINPQRTEVRSPVDGYVTNFLMRVGDFAGPDAQPVGDRRAFLLDRCLF